MDLAEDLARFHTCVGELKSVSAPESLIRTSHGFRNGAEGRLNSDQIEVIHSFGEPEAHPIAVVEIMQMRRAPLQYNIGPGVDDLARVFGLALGLTLMAERLAKAVNECVQPLPFLFRAFIP